MPRNTPKPARASGYKSARVRKGLAWRTRKPPDLSAQKRLRDPRVPISRRIKFKKGKRFLSGQRILIIRPVHNSDGTTQFGISYKRWRNITSLCVVDEIHYELIEDLLKELTATDIILESHVRESDGDPPPESEKKLLRERKMKNR